jgi:MFS family permease
VCAGAVYILGFTILQASAHDEIRGRIFGVFYVLIRFCLLLAFALAPFLSAALDGLSGHLTRTVGGLAIHHEVGFGSFVLPLPGTRLTLWLGGAIIIGAGLLARQGMRAGEPVSTSVRETSWFERVDSDASGREDSHMDTRQLDGPALPGAPG